METRYDAHLEHLAMGCVSQSERVVKWFSMYEFSHRAFVFQTRSLGSSERRPLRAVRCTICFGATTFVRCAVDAYVLRLNMRSFPAANTGFLYGTRIPYSPYTYEVLKSPYTYGVEERENERENERESASE